MTSIARRLADAIETRDRAKCLLSAAQTRLVETLAERDASSKSAQDAAVTVSDLLASERPERGRLCAGQARTWQVCARKLAWGDVNLDKGMVSLDENETDRPRSWVLTAGVARVLDGWKKKSAHTKTTDPVFVGIKWEKLAPI